MPPKTRGGSGGRGRGAGGDSGGRGRGGRGGQQSRGQPRTVSQAQPGRGRGQGHGSRSVSQPAGDAPPPTRVPPVPSLPPTQQATTVSETVPTKASVQPTQALAGATVVVFLLTYFTNIVDQFIGPSTSSWLRYWRSSSQHFRQPLQACKYSRRKDLSICLYNPHKRWGCPNEGYGNFSLGKQRS